MSKSSREVYNVESISDEQLFRGRARYLVHWEGYDDITWEYASTIDHTPAFASYMKAKKKRILSISDSRTDHAGVHYRVSYTQGDDIWEPASFVKGTKALKAFRAQRKLDALESDSVSSASNSTSTPSVASNSSSTASSSTSAPPLSSLAAFLTTDSVEGVARISNHRFCPLGGVEYFVTSTTGEQTWVHSESLNLVGDKAATLAYIHAIVADVDPVKVLRKSDEVVTSLRRQLRRLDPFLPSTSEARDQFRACTSSWKLASMFSHEALLLAQEKQAAFSQTSSTTQPSTPATSSRLPNTSLHSDDEYRAFTAEDALDLVQRGGDSCFQEMRELVAVRGIAWLNKCRDRFGWGMVHYAAAGPLNGSNKSLEDGPRFLKWLYEDHGAMNQLTSVEHAGVAAGSTCLHVAMARHQLKCVEFILSMSDDGFVNYRNGGGVSARDMVVPFANAFTAWEKTWKKKQTAAAAALNSEAIESKPAGV